MIVLAAAEAAVALAIALNFYNNHCHGRRRSGGRAERLMDRRVDLDTTDRCLGLAWLLPLASFALIVLFGPRMGKARHRWPAMSPPARSGTSCLLSLFVAALGLAAALRAAAPATHADAACSGRRQRATPRRRARRRTTPTMRHARTRAHDEHAADAPPPAVLTGDWYTLGQFGTLQDHDRLLHRLADRRHVLHGHAHRHRASTSTPSATCTTSCTT